MADVVGQTIELNVVSPREAFRALIIQFPKLRWVLRDGAFHVVTRNRDEERDLDVGQMDMSLGDRDLFVIPAVQGGGKGTMKVILGVIIMAIAIIAAIPTGGGSLVLGTELVVGEMALGVTAGSLLVFGAMMTLSGVAMMLAPSPNTNNETVEPAAARPSFVFDGAVNLGEPGNAIPLVYGGPIRVGSVVISAGITTEELAV
jgi:predicted phage tail protein